MKRNNDSSESGDNKKLKTDKNKNETPYDKSLYDFSALSNLTNIYNHYDSLKKELKKFKQEKFLKKNMNENDLILLKKHIGILESNTYDSRLTLDSYMKGFEKLLNEIRKIKYSLCDHDWDVEVQYHNERYYTCKICGYER